MGVPGSLRGHQLHQDSGVRVQREGEPMVPVFSSWSPIIPFLGTQMMGGMRLLGGEGRSPQNGQ